MTSPEVNGTLVSLGRGGLHALRRALSRDYGDQAAALLQEAGYAGGAQIFESFRDQLARDGVSDPGDLDASQLEEVLSQLFSSLGWGTVAVTRIGGSGLAIDAPNWAEAEPGAHTDSPCCFMSVGLFTDFFTRLAGEQVAVMEVECGSRGDPRCRFLIGSTEALDAVYNAMVEGKDYTGVL